MNFFRYRFPFIVLVVVLGITTAFLPVQADHSWGGYHWARQSNPFALSVGDNLSTAWDSYLTTTLSDWSVSTVLDMTAVLGKTTARKCRPTAGRVEVCNATYGKNGWLGIAQIWLSGEHITQGVTKLNDTYFNTTTYNKPAWKNLVMCQEVGHTLGLDHQDENFNNTALGTCMDYSADPTLNQHPNAHDYEQLELIYSHLDAITTISQATAQSLLPPEAVNPASDYDEPSAWGQLMKEQGRTAIYTRDLGAGQKLVTFVIWADESPVKRNPL